jgi:hypothetical protein
MYNHNLFKHKSGTNNNSEDLNLNILKEKLLNYNFTDFMGNTTKSILEYTSEFTAILGLSHFSASLNFPQAVRRRFKKRMLSELATFMASISSSFNASNLKDVITHLAKIATTIAEALKLYIKKHGEIKTNHFKFIYMSNIFITITEVLDNIKNEGVDLDSLIEFFEIILSVVNEDSQVSSNVLVLPVDANSYNTSVGYTPISPVSSSENYEDLILTDAPEKYEGLPIISLHNPDDLTLIEAEVPPETIDIMTDDEEHLIKELVEFEDEMLEMHELMINEEDIKIPNLREFLSRNKFTIEHLEKLKLELQKEQLKRKAEMSKTGHFFEASFPKHWSINFIRQLAEVWGLVAESTEELIEKIKLRIDYALDGLLKEFMISLEYKYVRNPPKTRSKMHKILEHYLKTYQNRNSQTIITGEDTLKHFHDYLKTSLELRTPNLTIEYDPPPDFDILNPKNTKEEIKKQTGNGEAGGEQKTSLNERFSFTSPIGEWENPLHRNLKREWNAFLKQGSKLGNFIDPESLKEILEALKKTKTVIVDSAGRVIEGAIVMSKGIGGAKDIIVDSTGKIIEGAAIALEAAEYVAKKTANVGIAVAGGFISSVIGGVGQRLLTGISKVPFYTSNVGIIASSGAALASHFFGFDTSKKPKTPEPPPGPPPGAPPAGGPNSSNPSGGQPGAPPAGSVPPPTGPASNPTPPNGPAFGPNPWNPPLNPTPPPGPPIPPFNPNFIPHQPPPPPPPAGAPSSSWEYWLTLMAGLYEYYNSSQNKKSGKPINEDLLKNFMDASKAVIAPVESTIHTSYDILGQFGKDSKNKIAKTEKASKSVTEVSKIMVDAQLPDSIKNLEITSKGSYGELAYAQGFYKKVPQEYVSGRKTNRRFDF